MTESPANSGAQSSPPITSRVRAFGESLIRFAAGWIDDRRFVDAHRRYLDDLDRSGELGGLLEAVGITRDQLRTLAISPLASVELLTGMMERLGLAGIDVEGADSQTIHTRCMACDNWRQCHRWLESGAQDDGYREFCPNSALLDRLRAQHDPPAD